MSNAAAAREDSLRITEIFYSLQGEARTVGLPTVFVRLTGCPLRCVYCDTEYAFHGGQQQSMADILDEVAGFTPAYVTVTGGEPLAQPGCHDLLTLLCDAGYEVSLETSGAMSVAQVDPRVVKVLDLKTPASGEMARNDYDNIQHLTPQDQVKFVICDREDYEWARFKLDELGLVGRVDDILFSPSFGQQDATQLADWILEGPSTGAAAIAAAQAAVERRAGALGMTSKEKAVVLVSGGLDSTTVLAMAMDQGFDCHTLSFDYGQRHRSELLAAERVSSAMGVAAHKVVHLDLDSIGGSALTDMDIAVPEEETDGIPITYVPARNTVFLSIALGWAEVLDARRIFIGVNAVDYSGYPDCRPEFISAFESMANLATKVGVEEGGLRIDTPLIDLGKHEIIRRGLELGVDYSLTVSCYQATEDGRACGKCDSCRLRREGFEAAGVPDPTRYA